MTETCDICGKEVEMCEVGYLGPVNRDDERCDPFMQFECLCVDCDPGPPNEEDTNDCG